MHSPKKLASVLAKLPPISVSQSFYRSVNHASLHKCVPPKPLYALGPGLEGSRYTPKGGPPCLYVSAKPLTTLCEVAGIASALLDAGAIIQQPLTLYAIRVQLKHVLDLTDNSVVEALGTTFAELDAPWEEQIRNSKPVPTHVLAIAAHNSGRFQGIRFFSHEYPGTVNLAIWTNTVKRPSFIEVIDASGELSDRLPKPRQERTNG
jgi:RES domain-containing protein